MAILENFFFTSRRRILIVPGLIILLLSNVFGGKYYRNHSEYGSTEISIGHPLPLIAGLVFVSIWFWTIANYLNRTRQIISASKLLTLKRTMFGAAMSLSALSIIAYANAEELVHNGTAFSVTFFALAIAALSYMYFQVTTYNIIRFSIDLNADHNQPFWKTILLGAFLPFVIFLKYHALLKNLYENDKR